MQSETGKYIRNTKSSTIEALDTIIAAALLKGRSVIIPDLGYLESVLFSGRRTVLFKAADPQDLPLEISLDGREGNAFSILSQAVSRPLKEGKVVSMPSLGIFRPLGKEDGTFHVSFTPSPFFRKQLNEPVVNEENKEKSRKMEIKMEIKDEPIVKIEQERSVSSEQNNDIIEEVAVTAETRQWNTGEYSVNNDKETESMLKIVSYKEKEAEEETFLSDEISAEEGNKIGTIWVAACASVVALIVLVGIFWLKPKNDQPVRMADSRYESVNLVDLARKNYGNPAFWVYIYDSNRDKLASPVNIPRGVKLTIPDLSEYNIDIKDSMEIIRANIHSESILQKYYSSK